MARFLNSPQLSQGLGILLFLFLFLNHAREFIPGPQSFVSSEIPFFKEAKIFVFLGDIPPNESSKFDFHRIDPILWHPIVTWAKTEDLLKLTQSEFLWIMVENQKHSLRESSFFLLEHMGIDFEIYDISSNIIFKFNKAGNGESTTNSIKKEISWIEFSKNQSSVFYIRLFHKKGTFFILNALSEIVGSKEEIYNDIIKRNILLAIISSFFLISGIICILIYLVNYKKKYLMLLDFGLFSFVFGTFYLTINELIRIIVLDKSALFYSTIALSSILFVPILSGLRRFLFPENFKILEILLIANLIFGAFNILIVLFFKYDTFFAIYSIFAQWMLIFFSIANNFLPALVCYLSWRYGNLKGRNFFLSFSISLLFTIYQLYLFSQNQRGFESIVFWSVLIPIFIQALEIERNLFSSSMKLKEFETDLLKKSNLLKEAELKNLQSKMNPHFLFNALNTIHALLRTKPELVENSILDLANNYRYTLENAEKELVSLNDEIEFLKDYLKIQKLRFFDSLVIVFQIDPCSFPLFLPPITLQPIVENCFKHGFQSSNENKFSIQIFGNQVSTSEYQLRIIDNGAGLSAQMKENPKLIWNRSLGNIRQRLTSKIRNSDIQASQNYPSGFFVTIRFYTRSLN